MLLEKLSHIVGAAATWRNVEQRDAVDALFNVDREVIIALRTGIGKTAVAILPSMFEDAITVIVVPLIALVDDWKRRLDQLGIKYEWFGGAKQPDLKGTTNIILTSCDLVRHEYWNRAITKVQANRTIARVVFDEGHFYFTDNQFRGVAMQDAYQIRTKMTCQIVILSATIPPKSEDFFKTEFMLKDPIIIRGSSARPELKMIKYEHCGDYNATLARFRTWFDALPPLEGKDRYLVFVKSMDDGFRLAEDVGLEFYHANSEKYPVSEEARIARYNRWIDGDYKGLIASTALSAGNDYKFVRYTCHFGTPHNMVSLVQQEGRAGRDGNVSECVLIPYGYPKADPDPRLRALCGCEEVAQLAVNRNAQYPKYCLRFLKGEVIDGKGVGCLDLTRDFVVCSECTRCKWFTF